MKLLFTPEALASYNDIKAQTPKEAENALGLIKEILAHPEDMGHKSDKLSGALSGLWSCKYGVFREIIYSYSESEVKIYAIGKKLYGAKASVGEYEQTQYTDEEYRSVLAQMEANRGKGETPKVGIFWYSVGRDELFGVVSHPVDDYSRANASDGRITCSELHEDVWKKEFYKQRYKGDGTGLYIGQYQDKPRGRVFYNIEDDSFEVACGKWLQDYPHVYEMIIQEFDLPPERTKAKYAIHWDIGQSWR